MLINDVFYWYVYERKFIKTSTCILAKRDGIVCIYTGFYAESNMRTLYKLYYCLFRVLMSWPNVTGSYFYIFSIVHLNENGCSVCPFLLPTQGEYKLWKHDLFQLYSKAKRMLLMFACLVKQEARALKCRIQLDPSPISWGIQNPVRS